MKDVEQQAWAPRLHPAPNAPVTSCSGPDGGGNTMMAATTGPVYISAPQIIPVLNYLWRITNI